MLALISPAKTLDFSKIDGDFTKPQMLDNSFKLIENLKNKSILEIQKLMKISEKLSILNYDRYQNFSKDFTSENSKAAIFAFKGDVYTGLNIESFDNEDIDFAKNSVRILSGLYGILKPLDLIQPYRLEMGTKLQVDNFKNLYQFWGDKISQEINKIESDFIINLASNEYFKAIDKKTLKAKIINMIFKETKNGEFKIIGIHAKKARGRMINFIVKNRINNPQDLQQFNLDGYNFKPELSDETNLVWIR